MSTIATTYSDRIEERGSAGWAHMLRQAIAGLANGMSAYSRYQELSLLSDAELGRRGLTRASIGRRAMFGEQDPLARA
jgi:hypothetical protein